MSSHAYSQKEKVTASQEYKNRTINIATCLFALLEAFNMYHSWKCRTLQDRALIKSTVVVLVSGDQREQLTSVWGDQYKWATPQEYMPTAVWNYTIFSYEGGYRLHITLNTSSGRSWIN